MTMAIIAMVMAAVSMRTFFLARQAPESAPDAESLDRVYAT
jgi:hypothetical protein